MKMNILDDNGNIPAETRCPVANAKACKGYKDGWCSHQGYFHPEPYSCAIARGWALIQSIKSENGIDG